MFSCRDLGNFAEVVGFRVTLRDGSGEGKVAEGREQLEQTAQHRTRALPVAVSALSAGSSLI